MQTLAFPTSILAVAIGTIGFALAQPADRVQAAAAGGAYLHRINVIDGKDDRDSLLVIGAELGLSLDEIARIRKVSGYVGCFLPTPSLGSGALFLTNDQILTAGHIFFDPTTGERRSKCFFKNQDEPSVKIDLVPEAGAFRCDAAEARLQLRFRRRAARRADRRRRAVPGRREACRSRRATS